MSTTAERGVGRRRGFIAARRRPLVLLVPLVPLVLLVSLVPLVPLLPLVPLVSGPDPPMLVVATVPAPHRVFLALSS
jgi:hypothetical protein